MNAVPTVFIVDDDPAVLKSLSRLLRLVQLTVVTSIHPRNFLNDTILAHRAVSCST